MTTFKKMGFAVSLLTILLVFAAVLTGCNSSSTTATPTPTHQPVTINLAAAASLQGAMTEIDTLYVQQNPYVTISTDFDSSGNLQTRIEKGEPTDIFMSAGAKQMNALQNESLIVNASRENLLRNILVLMVPNDSTLGITNFTDLTATNVSKIAVGDPGSAPCGVYALQAFAYYNITSQLQSKLVNCSSATAVVTAVQTDAVDAGVAYLTDVYNKSNVKIVAQGPTSVNNNIVYPMAVINGTQNLAEVEQFEAFLSSKQSVAIFEKYGFTMY